MYYLLCDKLGTFKEITFKLNILVIKTFLELQKEKEDEIARRKIGQQMQEFKDEQRKRQLLEAAAQRKKDKVLEK